MSLMDILAQAVNAANANNANQHLEKVSQHAPNDVLAKGLSAAFDSKQTPPIGNMVGQLFGQSNGAQQAGVLNTLLRTLGPIAMASLASGALSKVLTPGQTQVTPEQAAKLKPQEIETMVNQANEQHAGVADQMGNFYAEHKGLVNTLGGLAAIIALSKMKDHIDNR
jgi:hypothetical protein